MKLVHPDNLPKGIDQSIENSNFVEDVAKIRSVLDQILSSGIPRSMAVDAGVSASDNPRRNMGILRRLMASLLCNPIIFEAIGGKQDGYKERVFITALSEIDIEPNPVGEPTVPIRLVTKED